MIVVSSIVTFTLIFEYSLKITAVSSVTVNGYLLKSWPKLAKVMPI